MDLVSKENFVLQGSEILTVLFYLFVYCGGLLIALSGRPLYGLYIYFFSFYLHAPSQWWGQSLPDIRWSLIAAIITLGVVLFKPPARGLRFWTFHENKLLSLMAVFVCLQQFWVKYGVLHMDYVILFVKFLILIFIIQNIVVSAKELRGVIWANVLGTAYLAYYGISQFDGGRLEDAGANGMDANLVGMHFAAMVYMGAYLLMERFRYTHIILAIALSLILMGLFLTESRGSIIALGASGLLALFFHPQGSKPKFITLGLLGAISAAVLMGPQIVDRFEGMKKDNVGEVQDASAASRMVIINAQIEMWKKHPILGFGHRGTLVQSPAYLPEDYLTGPGVRASHNLTMALLVDHGIIGASLYFGAVLLALSKIFRYKFKLQKGETLSDDQKLYSHALLGAILALLCFIVGGQGSNNKKLEADIWLLALIPLIHREIQTHNQKRRKVSLETIQDEVYAKSESNSKVEAEVGGQSSGKAALV